MKVEHIKVEDLPKDPVKFAREFLKWFIDHRIPISPTQARELYTDAKLPIPDSLKPRVWTDEELLEGERLGKLLFKAYLE